VSALQSTGILSIIVDFDTIDTFGEEKKKEKLEVLLLRSLKHQKY